MDVNAYLAWFQQLMNYTMLMPDPHNNHPRLSDNALANAIYQGLPDEWRLQGAFLNLETLTVPQVMQFATESKRDEERRAARETQRQPRQQNTPGIGQGRNYNHNETRYNPYHRNQYYHGHGRG